MSFLCESKVKFLHGEFTSYSTYELNSLAILLSGVDRAKAKLGWKLRLVAGFERSVISSNS